MYIQFTHYNTFDIATPGVVSMTRAHRDSDFRAHHGCEINFWIPITRVWGSNSLYVESAPGLKDFKAFDMRYGEMAIFNGSRCLHYTEANRTEAVRVSFDFRVIPKSLLKGWRHVVGKHELAQYDFMSSEEREHEEIGADRVCLDRSYRPYTRSIGLFFSIFCIAYSL